MNGINLDALFERYDGFIESLAYGLFTPPHESSCAVIHTYNMLKIYYDSKIFVCENRNWRILGSSG